MKKQLSIKTMEAFKANRVKAGQLTNGQTFLCFVDGRLYQGEACRCDECPTVGTVNGGTVDGATTPESALLCMPFVHSKLVQVEDVGCYDADGSGAVLCSDCAAKRSLKAGAK